MICAERLDYLDALIERGDLLRGQWTDGHDRACLLAALSPEAGAAEDASHCPAEVMPAWLAQLTPWLDDEPSAEAWPAIVRRYARLARQWHCLDAAAWERARVGALVAILTEARSHVDASEMRARPAIDAVLAWLRAGAPEAQRDTLLPASHQARSAAAVRAATAAAWAVESLRPTSPEEAASEAVQAASASASWSNTASRSAADRIAAGVLDAIEREVEACPRT